MRLREFITEQDIATPTAMSQRAQGLVGSIASSFKKLGDQPLLYYKGYQKYQDAKRKKDKAAADKAERDLEKVAKKMTPVERQATEKEIRRREKQNQPGKPWWMQDGSKTTTKPTMGQTAQGSDGKTYTWKGQQWVSPTGGIKRKNITITKQ
tara:strand:+ start:28 stop:483 length:456 start_codon:yes stop_codon:yes gene_type:complete